ncbi:outer membrane protein assembly factor BamE [uncultured Deefgea sp.]|uniref:outer membrane protein assembly factor BamE domain-containing protein n=1 Tax=uncultured Deefgea sp. TaxID=1304914 RepID=UPI002597356F|nr:outer membrane protein assembly factor BamE [uncultured Deefgea sp.]
MKRYFILSLLVLLMACSKITAENYNKVTTGMSRAEVVAILGEPTQSESGGFLGIQGETAMWKDGKVQITAQFVNQKLLTHSMVKQ